MGKRTSNVDKIPLVLTSWYGKILTVTISVVLLAEGRLLRQVVPVMSLAEHSRRKRINRNAFKLCPAFAKAKTFSCSNVSGPECNRDTCLEWTIGETYWSTWIRQQKLRNPNLFVISEMCLWCKCNHDSYVNQSPVAGWRGSLNKSSHRCCRWWFHEYRNLLFNQI